MKEPQYKPTKNTIKFASITIKFFILNEKLLQPSSQLFCKFDRLLLLAGGRTCFLGDTHQAAKFFTR